MSVLDQLKISLFWFASNFLWGALLLVMLPAEVERMDPARKAQTLGLVTGAASIVALIVPLVIGPLSDRCASRWGRRRPYIGVGVLINLTGLALMALAFGERSIPLYFVAYVVVQLGNNIAGAAYAGVIPDVVPEHQRGAASGYMAIMTQFGTLAGVFITALLIPLDSKLGDIAATQIEGLRYVVIAMVLALLGILTLWGVKEKPLPCRPPKLNLLDHIVSLWIDPRKYPDFAWVWITRFLVMLGFYGFLPFLQYYLHDVIGVAEPSKTVSLLIGVILVGASASGLVGGMISDKIGRKRVVYVANAIMAVMSFGLVFCRTIPQVLVVGILFGIGYGAYVSVDWALGTDVLPSKADAGKDLAVWHIAMTLPQAVSAPLAGYLISSFGSTKIMVEGEPFTQYTIAGYTAMLVLCATFVLIGAVLLRNVRSVR